MGLGRGKRFARVACRLLLHRAVRDDRDRPHRRRRRDLVRAHERLVERLQRRRRVVPLDVVANRLDAVLRGVNPLEHAALVAVEVVARDDHHGHAVTPRVVDRHRGMLDADGAVARRDDRLAGDLRIAMGHRDRLLLVDAGDELGLAIAPVVQDRLVQPSEARARVGRDIVDVEVLEEVDHHVGGRVVDEVAGGFVRAVVVEIAVLARELRAARRRRRPLVGGGLRARGWRAGQRRRPRRTRSRETRVGSGRSTRRSSALLTPACARQSDGQHSTGPRAFVRVPARASGERRLGGGGGSRPPEVVTGRLQCVRYDL